MPRRTISDVRLVSARGSHFAPRFRRPRARGSDGKSEGQAITSRRNLGQGALFSGKVGATESPSAAFVGLYRGALAFSLLGLEQQVRFPRSRRSDVEPFSWSPLSPDRKAGQTHRQRRWR